MGNDSNSFLGGTVRLLLAVLGVLALLAGLGAWLVDAQFDLPPRILLAVGVLLIGVYVALDPEDVWAKLTGRSALASGNAVVVAISVLVILGLINVVATRYPRTWDLTANHQNTLAQQSVQIVHSLPGTVTATGYFTTGNGEKTTYQRLLQNFANESNGRLQIKWVDPQADPGKAIQAGVTVDGTTIFQMGDKKQNITATTEQDVDTALLKLIRPPEKVYFTIGHGERDTTSSAQDGYAQIKQQLDQDNFSVATLNLTATRAVPSDAAEVVVAGPTQPFTQEEKNALKAYLQGGGHVMIMLDPDSKATFNDLLQPWGVSFMNGLVVDPAINANNDASAPVVQSYGTSPLTTNFRLLTVFPVTRPIQVPSKPPTGVTVSTAAQSSQASWDATDPQHPQQKASDPKGPLPLMVSVQQPLSNPTISSGATPAPSGTPGPSTQPAANPAASPAASPSPAATPAASPTPAANQPPRETRLVLVGNSNLVANAFVGGSGNSELFLNATTWLSQQDKLIALPPPPPADTRTMMLTGTQMNLVVYSSMIFLPLAVLAVGLGVWWARR